MPAHDARRTAPLRYVALGDSYTIGTGVRASERWPNRLVARPASAGPGLRIVSNLAVEGYTSADVIGEELPRLVGLRPEFASVLVGVNDVVREVPADRYRRNVETILDALLARLAVRRLLVVSVPDYTVTPRGGEYGEAAARRAAIVDFNEIAAEAAALRGIAFVDVFDLSVRAKDDRSLVAADGLHPSGAQYALWVERIGPVVERLLAAT